MTPETGPSLISDTGDQIVPAVSAEVRRKTLDNLARTEMEQKTYDKVPDDFLPQESNIPAPQPPITRKQWKQALRLYFTVRRTTVKACGHKYNPDSDPRTNCDSCWAAYFQNNGEMTRIADECFTEAGRDVLERSRGKKFVRQFIRFMAVVSRLQREAESAKGVINGEDEVSSDSTTSGDGEPTTDTSIGGLAGEAQTIGGIAANGDVHDYVAENPVDEGSTEGLSPSFGTM